MGIFDTWKGRIDARLSELAEDSRDQLAADEALAKAEQAMAQGGESSTDVLNRQRYRYRRASLVDPSLMPTLGEGGYGIYRPRYSHLSNKTLKEMSLRDPIVNAIFQTRIQQIARFSRPQENRYEPGFRFMPRDPSIEIKPGSPEEAEIAWLTDYIRNCGSNEDREPKSKMDFDTFLRLMVRDRLTFGAVAIETIRNHVGGIHSFLPAPTESIYYANRQLPQEILAQAQASQNAAMTGFQNQADEMRDLADAQEERDRQRDDDEDIEFVQVVNGRVHQTFTRKELLYKLGNPQNFIENNGYCFLPGTAFVRLQDHVALVEDVVVGDVLLDKDRELRRVVELKHRHYAGEVITLRVRGLSPVEVTSEHPLLVLAGNQRQVKNRKPATYKMAKDVAPGDYLCVPKIKPQSGIEVNLTSTITLDEDFAWFLGLYVGDGCIQKDERGNPKQVCLDIGTHETWILDRLTALFDRLKLSHKTQSFDKCVRVRVYSASFARLVGSVCPGLAHTKEVPAAVLSAKASVKRAFIEGWIDADGNHNKASSASTLRGVTVSVQLAYAIAEMSNELGHLAKVKKASSRSFGKRCDHFVVSWRTNVVEKNTVKGKEFRYSARDQIEDDKFFYVRVSSSIRSLYEGPVFNFEVETSHNYIANQVVSHNCIGELEMATLTITGHLQAENYNKLFFTHGFASRGLIHIAGDVSPSQLQAFRAQWHAQVSGNENSWRTPIIAGVDGVEWIPLSATNRDMEYSVYIDHIIRTLCAIFAISPVEIGFEHLGRGQGQGGLGSEDNNTKIQHSQVRGLKPLLTWIETIINEDIVPNISEEFAARYKFQFVGLEIESKTEEINRQTAETAVRSTVNDVRRESGQDPVLGGDIICNPLYYQALLQTHKIGEIREFLFGYVGDSENPEYNYIADPLYLQNLELMIQAEQQAMMAEAQAGMGGGGEFGEEGEEEGLDENGNPTSEEGDEGFGPEAGGDESASGPPPDEGVGGAEAGQDSGASEKKFSKSRRRPQGVSAGLLRKAAKVGWANRAKALAKANTVTPHQHGKVKVLDGELERARRAHLQAYKRIEGPMVRDVLNALKDEVSGGKDRE